MDRHNKEKKEQRTIVTADNKEKNEQRTILTAENITKKYGERLVLDGISLSVHAGEGIALVGENGCGKSTLLRILSGLTVPDGGSITQPEPLAMAWIPDRFDRTSMTIPEFLKYMMVLEEKAVDGETIRTCFSRLFLDSMLDVPMKYMSKGTLQKVAVLQALLGEKQLLFMDEPLSGQDTMSQLNFLEMMREKKQEGMSLLIACHEPYLVEALADRIYRVQDGKLVDGAPYVFGLNPTRCAFLVHFTQEQDESFHREFADEAFLEPTILSHYGDIWRIETDLAFSGRLFTWLTAQKAHIMKYQEMQA